MRSQLCSIQSLVVKIGTQTLSDPATKRLDVDYIHTIAQQVAEIMADRNISVTVVSSGAVGAGMAELNLQKRPTDLPVLQAVAAVGQRRLMDAWAQAFAPHQRHVAQVLLTREDIDSRKRFLNLRNTIHAVHELGCVPIVNENDTISTDEMVRISFGDNDILAAHVSAALRADLLVLLSNVDGVLDVQGQSIRTIEKTEQALSLIRRDKSQLGKGGMNSKFTAAGMMTSGGEYLVVAHGRSPDVLHQILDGQDIGTIFLPRRARSTGRAKWIGAARAKGSIIVDDGATVAHAMYRFCPLV
jgi:glutamate 5-kinase